MSKTFVLAAGLFTLLLFNRPAAAQMAIRLPLQNGHYVPDDVDCDNPPLMQVLIWDSVGFSRGRRSLCTTDVYPEDKYMYALRTSCQATVEGNVREYGMPAQVFPAQLIVLESTHSFTLGRLRPLPYESPVRYHRCAKP
jgi:hypothetical protein